MLYHSEVLEYIQLEVHRAKKMWSIIKIMVLTCYGLPRTENPYAHTASAVDVQRHFAVPYHDRQRHVVARPLDPTVRNRAAVAG